MFKTIGFGIHMDLGLNPCLLVAMCSHASHLPRGETAILSIKHLGQYLANI